MGDEKDDFKVIDRRGRSTESPKAEPAAEAPRSGAGFTMKEPAPPPQVDFATLVLSLATGAMIHLGLTPDPATGKVTKNLELARQNIEILSLLQTKTKGNLTPDEDQLLQNLLAEIRLRFVEASKK